MTKQYFPIYFLPAGQPTGQAAQLEAVLACQDPTGGENHRTNGMMWRDTGMLLKPIPQERFWELHAFVSKVTHTFPYACRISDDSGEEPLSLEDTVFIWASGDDDDRDEFEEGSGDLMVALTRQCIFIHEAAHWSSVEKLIGFAALHSVPLIAGPHFSLVSERDFTGYEMPEQPKREAKVFRLLDGDKKPKKPE